MKNKSKLFMVLSMVIFGSVALFVKKVGLGSGEIALYRSLIALILIGVYLLANKQKIDFKSIKKDILLLFLSGTALGFNWIFLFEAYNYTSVSVATLSYYFSPVILVVLSCVFLGEKLNLKTVLCFIVAVIGMVLIIDPKTLFGEGGSIMGVLLGLIAAVFYAVVVLLNMFIKNVSGIKRTFLQFLAAATLLLPYVLFTNGINILSLNSDGLISLLILGIVHSGVAYCIYFSSVKNLKGSEVAVLSYIDPLVAVIISFVFLKEPFSLPQAIGGLLILTSSLLINKKRAD